MLITDRDEIVRLKLIHGHIHGKLIEFAETYSVSINYSIQTNTFVLVHVRKDDWSISHIEQDGISVQNQWGGYGGGNSGQEKYIKTKWRAKVKDVKPTWPNKRYEELKAFKQSLA